MASLLETQVRKLVAQGFKGRLLTGTLRRETPSGVVNGLGDPTGPTVTTYTFDGIVDTFNAAFAATAGIPVTDVRILIIAGSLSVEAKKDDKVKIRNEWFQLRQLIERDTALAAYTFAGFAIPDPVGNDMSDTFDSDSTTFDSTEMTFDQG